ncbi:3'-exo-deoxyribonuclease [Streptococcus pyogenes]|nr:3'-exo-deoxyribonuclease [Streptococcus pyogenes]
MPTKRLIWQIQAAIDVPLVLPTKNVKAFTNLLARGFTDTFRYLHGDIPHVYTWWAQRSKTSKINNTGWRIDYWLASNRIVDKVKRSEMISSGERQDHTPILLDIDL